MGLFKKIKKENIEEKKDNEVEVVSLDDTKPEIEVLDLDKKDEKIVNTLEFRKENRLLLLIVILLIIFVILLPTITSWIDKKSIFSYNKQVQEIVNNKTVDGMLEMDKEEGSITVKNIRFYNPSKKTNNELSIVYLPESSIKDVNDLNIYIEFYNSNKMVIYRTKFVSDKKLERKVHGTINIKVNEMIFKEAKYAKVTIIKDNEFETSDEVLICTQKFTDENYEVEYKTTYNFSQKGLTSYQVTKKANKKENTETPIEEEETTNKYADEFKKEAEMISETNIEELTYDEDYITYTVDLFTLDTKKSDFSPSYNLGNVKRQIKLGEESKKWSCK